MTHNDTEKLILRSFMLKNLPNQKEILDIYAELPNFFLNRGYLLKKDLFRLLEYFLTEGNSKYLSSSVSQVLCFMEDHDIELILLKS